MRKINLVLACILALGLICATVSAEQVSLENGKITFDGPEGFSQLSDEMIALKYPSTRRPRYVIANETGATSIAYDLKPHRVPENKIEEMKDAFSQVFSRVVPGIKWIEKKVIELSGKKWGYLEMTSNAIDTDIHNIVIFTGYKDQMLIFNFNSTKEQFSSYDAELRKSLNSIQVTE